MKVTDKAWLAGIIDGEGYVALIKTNHGRYQVKVEIAMTHEPTIKEISHLLGRGYRTYRVRGGNRKNQHRWSCVSRDAVHLLTLVVPYLRTKRKQALLAIKYGIRPRTGTTKLNSTELARRDRMFKKMRSLNHRGIS